MSDNISRQDAIEAVCANCLRQDLDVFDGCLDEDCSIKPVLESLPSTDRKGHWKHLKGDEWLCSNCGYVVWTEGSWEHPLERGKDYCEHCGADMRGADDE